MFVFTDGASSSEADTASSAKLLHQNNITVFAVGIGNAKQSELDAIASDKKYVYTYTDFSMLDQIKDSFAREACEGGFINNWICDGLL